MRTLLTAAAALSTSIVMAQTPHGIQEHYPVVYSMELAGQQLFIEGAHLEHPGVGHAVWFADDPEPLSCQVESNLISCNVRTLVHTDVHYTVTASWWVGDESVHHTRSVSVSPLMIGTGPLVVTYEHIFVYNPDGFGRNHIYTEDVTCDTGTPIHGNVFLGKDKLDWSVHSASIVRDDDDEPVFRMKFVKVPRPAMSGLLIDIYTGFQAMGQLVCLL